VTEVFCCAWVTFFSFNKAYKIMFQAAVRFLYPP